MSTAAPIGLYRRLDNYDRQNGSDQVPLTPRQDRRRIHKERHALAAAGITGLASLGGVHIHASRAKNKPTPRRRKTRNANPGK